MSHILGRQASIPVVYPYLVILCRCPVGISIRVLLTLQESPVHNIAALDALLVMCRKKSKRESIQAIDVLKELWLTCLLPHERKLRKFEVRPFSTLLESASSLSPRDKNRKLMLWYAESQFKSCYRDYIGVLEVHLHDPVSSIRSKILGRCHMCACSHHQYNMYHIVLIFKKKSKSLVFFTNETLIVDIINYGYPYEVE